MPLMDEITEAWIMARTAMWLLSIEDKSEQLANAYKLFGRRGPDVIVYLAAARTSYSVKAR